MRNNISCLCKVWFSRL